ncbi:hypothetical protein DPMN_148567, partial [Dreissena polymorpha]
EKRCTEKDGWCVEKFNDRCRDIMYEHVNKLISISDSVDFNYMRVHSRKGKSHTRQVLESEDESDEPDDDTSMDVDT